ncbi:mitochondrial dicarboxylate carrier protein, putative [Talaromyces stipitatus ATCC 10500]|uniref:Mitochondrial dicarboxylate carrier protein, putative n=1 Tax=Talaromyces stipitatus (strain ATCC 10500 / CBS 375.48 / QM 6759 / NRRL 1006) TaxID=441959 RepID=B8LTJ4_TALSN|nr:mitochondrial dicarboxylate carrier protein, putative [Talaromyces stipitatus ATCC 10500]EED23072.1 mitochondrial dicarboxylate carrier protein, putative [Talaromyces stipitatus ATCC 10500]
MASRSITESASSATKSARESTKAAIENPSATATSFLRHPYMQAALPFINGGLAGMTATVVIQPVDMIKVRLQLAGEGQKTGPKPTALGITKNIIASGKVLDLYTGLSAGLLRQAVYTTARLGFFDTFITIAKTRAAEQGRSVSFGERALAGLTAGGLAAMIGNPADLALIQSRANYRSVIDALSRISKTEGIGALWAGATPTVVRAMALNLGQLAFFSESKSQLKAHTNLSPQVQTFAASAIAGFFASFLSLPFDFVKTRLQKQQKNPVTGELPYKGVLDCTRKVIKDEGWLRFYRGFGTYYIRIAPHAMVTLIVADYLNLITK